MFQLPACSGRSRGMRGCISPHRHTATFAFEKYRQWLAHLIYTASEMTCTVSSGALNSTPTNYWLCRRIFGKLLQPEAILDS